jgi:hypothetical protein
VSVIVLTEGFIRLRDISYVTFLGKADLKVYLCGSSFFLEVRCADEKNRLETYNKILEAVENEDRKVEIERRTDD